MYSSNITEGGGGGFSLFNVKLYDAAVSYGNNNYISLGNTHTYHNRMVEGKYIFCQKLPMHVVSDDWTVYFG